jgi:hypothetical protein
MSKKTTPNNQRTTDPGSNYAIIKAVVPWEIGQQLANIAQLHSGEDVLVCLAPTFYYGKRSGSVWCVVEDASDPITIQVDSYSGHAVWAESAGMEGGYSVTNTATFHRNALAHFCKISEGRAEYLGDPGQAPVVIYDERASHRQERVLALENEEQNND